MPNQNIWNVSLMHQQLTEVALYSDRWRRLHAILDRFVYLSQFSVFLGTAHIYTSSTDLCEYSRRSDTMNT